MEQKMVSLRGILGKSIVGVVGVTLAVVIGVIIGIRLTARVEKELDVVSGF